VIFFAYQGIALSEKALIITGSIEILSWCSSSPAPATRTGWRRGVSW